MWRGQDPLTCQTAPFVISMHHALLRETSEHCNRSWWSVSKQLHERKTNDVHLETDKTLNRMEQNKLLYMVVHLHFIMCLMGKTEPSCLNYGLLCVCMRVSLHVHVCLSISYNVESFCWRKKILFQIGCWHCGFFYWAWLCSLLVLLRYSPPCLLTMSPSHPDQMM